MNGSYIEHRVKIDSFEGPVSLLLEMIENKKLNISDLSLSKIADEYLANIEDLESFPAEQAAQFVLVASILLLIKSRNLLPLLKYSEEEELDIEILKAKLRILRDVRNNGAEVFESIDKKQFFIADPISTESEVKFYCTEECNLENMRKTISKVSKSLLIFKRGVDVTVKPIVRLEDMMKRFEKILSEINTFSFESTAAKNSKKDFIVSFLAILELIKIGICKVEQDKAFSNIILSKDK